MLRLFLISRTFCFLLIVQLLTVTVFSATAHLRPGDNEYLHYSGEKYNYVIHKQDLPLLPQLIGYNQNLNKIYEQEFQWRLDEKPTLILTSPSQQRVNGFATILPHLMTQFYSGGTTGGLDLFSSSSWLYTLLIHEVNHLYQLNIKSGENSLPAYIKKILGNTPALFLFALPLFPAPNFAIPTFLIEGSAVLNENRFGIGGRLYSGHQKALFLTGIQEKRFPLKKVINRHFEFPTNEKYLVGSFFALWLAEKYGIENVNGFFHVHAKEYINPLLLKKSFVEHFGENYDKLYALFLEDYKTKALQLQKSSEKALATSYSFSPLNRIGDEILFFSGEDFRRPKRIGRYHRKTKKINFKSVDLPIGKPFLFKNEFHTVSSVSTSVETYEFSLIGDSYRSVPVFENKFIFDRHPQKGELYAPTDRGFQPAQLFSGKTNLGITHSSAIFNKKGDVYFFRQKGTMRIAYRNQTPLFTFQGHYGFPADFDSKGNLLFIASSQWGSSLYKFEQGKIHRISKLDTIADAKSISDSQTLIYEITARGYEVKIIDLETPKEELPAFYKYKFESQNKTFFNDINKVAGIYPQGVGLQEVKSSNYGEQTEVQKINSGKITPYRSVKNIKYSLTDLFFLKLPNGTVTSFQTLFSDPLAFSNISVQGLFKNSKQVGSYSEQKGTSANLFYLNKFHRTNWRLGYFFNKVSKTPKESKTFTEKFNKSVEANRVKKLKTSVYFGWDYPVYEKGHWKVWLKQKYSHTKEDSEMAIQKHKKDTKPVEKYHILTIFNLLRTVNFPLGFESYRKMALTLAHRFQIPDSPESDSHFDLMAYLKLNFGFSHQQFFILEGERGYSSNSTLGVERSLSNLSMNVLQLLAPKERLNLESVQKLGITYKKAVDTPIYFTKFPISLLRIAPTLKSQYLQFKSKGLKEEFFESSLGLEADVAFAHRVPLRAVFEVVNSKKLTEPSGVNLFLNFRIKTRF